jgi:hypothetical protein
MKEVLELKIDIPGKSVRAVSEGHCIEKELLQILSFCTGRDIITKDSESNLRYDEYSMPLGRTEKYGDRKYGISMSAQPIQSGVGVHGEDGEWRFFGLPDGIKITAHSRLDMRGGVNNFYSLKISGDNIRIKECIEYVKSVFGKKVKKIWDK